MDGVNRSKPIKKERHNPVYWGNSILKIVHYDQTIENGYNKQQAQKKSKPTSKTPEKKQKSTKPSLTSPTDGRPPEPQLPTNVPAAKVELKPNGAKNGTKVSDAREHGATVVPEPNDDRKDEKSQPFRDDTLIDITFPKLHLGPKGDMLALECGKDCLERPKSERDPIPRAHVWCNTHERHHCSGMSDSPCYLVVLCMVSVDAFNRKRVERHWYGVPQGEKDDRHHDRMEICPAENMDKTALNVKATQSIVKSSAELIRPSNEQAEDASYTTDTSKAIDVDEAEKLKNGGSRKRVRFSDKEVVKLQNDSSLSPE